MEILTYLLDGKLEHRDDQGNVSVLRPGRVQLMRAGSGIVHSEMNPSQDQPVHLLQIWIRPGQRNLSPGYEELDISLKSGELTPLATAMGKGGGLCLEQDASLFALALEAGGQVEHSLVPGRRAWVQIARGAGYVNDVPLQAGDGLGVSGEAQLQLRTNTELEALVFDLA
jgi:redox-sensitive bicupin YhaK (pirin superfamily)